MPRPKQFRKMVSPPLMKGFKPFGIPASELETVILSYDEYEAIRLLDYEGLMQEQAAERMNVSRPTLTRIYENARKTMAKAFVEGKMIVISGGNVEFDREWFRCRKCYKLVDGIENHKRCRNCMSYGNDELEPLNKEIKIKAIVLSDNKTLDSDLESEHGLSVYLETSKYKFLLDTGASDVFIRNAEKLYVDLSEVDFVFISHGHADHIGGLPYFLKINSKAKIIMSADIVDREYYSKRNGLHKISIDFDFAKIKDRIIFVDDEFSIGKSFSVYKNKISQHDKPLGNSNLQIKDVKGDFVPDDFLHELIFAAGDENLFVYTGCAHQGILNILETTALRFTQPIRWVMGGFHLLDSKNDKQYENKEELILIAKTMREKFPATDFFTGHCTGDEAYLIFKEILKSKLHYLFDGYKIANEK